MPLVKENGEIQTETSSEEAVPTTLREKLRWSKRELKSKWGFALFAFWCILKDSAKGTVPMIVALIVLLSFPLAMLAIGIINLYSCPADVYIPIFTLGWGVVAAMKVFFSLRVQYIAIRSAKNRRQETRKTLTCFSKVFQDVEIQELSHILSAAVLAASVGLGIMTYRTYGKWTSEKGTVNYCNPTFYYFAFCSTTVILCLSVVATCCVYPLTGAIVYSFINVYDDVSTVRHNRGSAECV